MSLNALSHTCVLAAKYFSSMTVFLSRKPDYVIAKNAAAKREVKIANW